MVTRRQTAAVALLAAALVGGCGNGSTGGSGDGVQWDDLSGHTYLSSDVLDSGKPYPLVPGSQVRLTFSEDGVSASAGCNTMSGSAHLDGDVLVVDGPLAMTEMACDDALMSQDDWLATFLGDEPVVAVSGDQLTLTGAAIAMTLIDEEVANPDLPLTGQTWVVTGLLSGSTDTGAVASVPQGVRATMRFADGVVTGTDGCNRFHGEYQVDGDRLTVGPMAQTLMACEGDAQQVADHVDAVLARPMTFSIDGNQLSLVAGGSGLYLTAR